MKKPNGYWTKERVFEESRKYQTRGEFKKANGSVYNVVRKNGWFDEMPWFGEVRKSSGYWTKEKAFEEAKKYSTRKEFHDKNQYAYNLSIKNGWIEEMDWLRSFLLTKKECFKRAKKFSSVKDFNANETRAYQKSLENGWLKEMDWLVPTTGTTSNPFWTFQKVKEVASLCKSRQEFNEKYSGASNMARRKGWYDKLGLPEFVIKEKVYCVYSYDWEEQTTSYIGLTYRKKGRNDEHHGNGKYSNDPYKSPVYSFAKENGLPIPEPKYHGEGLTLSEAQALEDKIKNEYMTNGYNVLNKGKTGIMVGSYGNVGIKWSYENTYNEAIKYKTSCEFIKKSPSAYNAAYRHGWLKNYGWMKFGHNRISIEEAENRARYYKTRTEFARNDATSYCILSKNKPSILDKIFGKSKTRKITIDECIEIAKKYDRRSKLAKERSSVYRTLLKNNLLDDFFPIKQKNQFG